MSDYIRKSALLEQLIGIDDEIVKGCIGVIQTQPTVDEKEIIRKTVEKIIKRLEKHKSDWNDDYNVPINNAIEIVKKVGGLNE